MGSTSIPIARTRVGVACSFDRVNNRFVLAYSDAIEKLSTVSRSPVLGSAWTTPQVIPSPIGGDFVRSADAPSLSFDPYFTGHASGLLSWWDVEANDQRTMWIAWSGVQNRYIDSSSFWGDITTTAEEDVLRTSIVVNAVGGLRHWAFGTQMNWVSGRWRREFVGALSTHADFRNDTSAGWFDWYVGSAVNSQIQESAYLRHIAYH
jgi:hypothetical protein